MGLACRRLPHLLALFLSSSCATTRPVAQVLPCTPRCLANNTCNELDAGLILARKPLLQCIGQQAPRGHLPQTHRCYRSLRLLESARWWLKTLISEGTSDGVYQISETTRREFLCKIEHLARSMTPEDVERIYMEMIRAFP